MTDTVFAMFKLHTIRKKKGRGAQDAHPHFHTAAELWLTQLKMLKCCFTSTETIGLLGTGGQDGHHAFHTAPDLWLTQCRQTAIYKGLNVRHRSASTSTPKSHISTCESACACERARACMCVLGGGGGGAELKWYRLKSAVWAFISSGYWPVVQPMGVLKYYKMSPFESSGTEACISKQLLFPLA